MFDFIGDIHGYADRLESLLIKLGYKPEGKGYTHSTRKALFVGDYIDRGPQIPRTLEIVKTMVDSGNAIALMGNHEYNALCFNAMRKEGGYLRAHSIKNIVQHYETLRQFKNREEEYQMYLDWFLELPLYWEEDGFRAVHACWDNIQIDFLKKHLVEGCLNEVLLRESTQAGNKLNRAVEVTLKGKETHLPNGQTFLDKDGHKRRSIRIRWWEDPKEMTYKSISVLSFEGLSEDRVSIGASHSYYGREERIVFFGHYWLTGEPFFFKENIGCLDFSVAKEGKLVAYRYDGEKVLTSTKVVFT